MICIELISHNEKNSKNAGQTNARTQACSTGARHITSTRATSSRVRVGSRVVSNAADRARLKPHADLDLLLEGPRLKLHQAFLLKAAFSESDLPMRVDAVAVDDLLPEWNIRAWRL